MRNLLLLAAISFALVGCNNPTESVERIKPLSVESAEDIFYSLAMFIFKNNAFGGQRNVEYFFLSMDPSLLIWLMDCQVDRVLLSDHFSDWFASFATTE